MNKLHNGSQLKRVDSELPLIPHKTQRNQLQQKIHQWVDNKFSKIFDQTVIEKPLNQKSYKTITKESLYTSLQKQLHLKYSINNLIDHLSPQYLQTLIKYVIEKKLRWIFTEETQKQQLQKPHQNISVELSYQLKQFYKVFQYKPSFHPNQTQIKANNKSSFSPDRTKSQFTNTSYDSFRNKCKPDFQFEFLTMFSVSLVRIFFEHFFTEVSIDRIFQSQIYVIIIHAFLDLQVSPNIFDIMSKKFYFKTSKKSSRNINTSLTTYQNNSTQNMKKYEHKFSHNQNSKVLIEKQKTKPALNSIKQVKIENNYPNNQESSSHQRINTSTTNIKSVAQLNSTACFSSKSFKKIQIKKDVLIKPATSIDNNLLTQRQNGLGKTSYNNSRFQSFLQNTKKMSLSPFVEELMAQGHLPTEEQYEFYNAVKQNLHVECLPPIIQKKININEYQKLNEIQNLKEIKKEVKSLDLNSKKNHIKTNDLSLAMNTFISTSCGFSKKKRKNQNLQVVMNFLQNDTDKHLLNDEQKQNFQLRSLPLRSANLKLKPQMSSNLYKFADSAPKSLLKHCQGLKKDMNFALKSDYEFKSKKNLTQSKLQIRTHERNKSNQGQNSYQEKKKKSTTQWQNFIKQLKHRNKQQTIGLGLTQNKNKKKSLQRQAYSKVIQADSNISTPSMTNSIVFTAKTRKAIAENMNQDQISQTQLRQSDCLQKKPQRQSLFAQLSKKLQLYELQKTDTIDVEQISDINRNQIEDNFKYSSLEGKVNTQNQISMSYKSHFKSFQLRKKLENFNQACKTRNQKATYSMFKIKKFNYPATFNEEESDDEE